MSAVTRTTFGRFVLLGTLYFAQGLPFGFFVQTIPVILRKQGVSLSAIGFTSLLTLPWALKFLWAPYLDRNYSSRLGRRRTWILAMQLAGVVVLAAVALIPGTGEINALMAAMFVLNLIAATQDIATDGLAVELLPPNERGFANGLQVAAYRVGMVIGGAVLLAVYADVGHADVFAIMAGLTALATIPVLASSEPPTLAAIESRALVNASAPSEPATLEIAGPSFAPGYTSTTPAAPRSVREHLAKAPHFLNLPGAWRVIALIVTYKFGEAAAQGMLRPFLVDHHMTLKNIAFIVGSVGFLGGMAGALIGGLLVGMIGRKRALLAFGVGQVITVVGYAYLAFGEPSYRELYIWAGFEHFASGLATAALFTAMMDWCRPEHSGTDYTVQASAVVIATGVSSTLGGISADALGYGGHFALCAVLCVVAIGVAAKLFPTKFPS